MACACACWIHSANIKVLLDKCQARALHMCDGASLGDTHEQHTRTTPRPLPLVVCSGLTGNHVCLFSCGLRLMRRPRTGSSHALLPERHARTQIAHAVGRHRALAARAQMLANAAVRHQLCVPPATTVCIARGQQQGHGVISSAPHHHTACAVHALPSPPPTATLRIRAQRHQRRPHSPRPRPASDRAAASTQAAHTSDAAALNVAPYAVVFGGRPVRIFSIPSALHSL